MFLSSVWQSNYHFPDFINPISIRTMYPKFSFFSKRLNKIYEINPTNIWATNKPISWIVIYFTEYTAAHISAVQIKFLPTSAIWSRYLYPSSFLLGNVLTTVPTNEHTKLHKAKTVVLWENITNRKITIKYTLFLIISSINVMSVLPKAFIAWRLPTWIRSNIYTTQKILINGTAGSHLSVNTKLTNGSDTINNPIIAGNIIKDESLIYLLTADNSACLSSCNFENEASKKEIDEALDRVISDMDDYFEYLIRMQEEKENKKM